MSPAPGCRLASRAIRSSRKALSRLPLPVLSLPWPAENTSVCCIFEPNTKNYEGVIPGRLRDTSLHFKKGKTSSSHPWKEPVGSRKPLAYQASWQRVGPMQRSTLALQEELERGKDWGQARHGQAGLSSSGSSASLCPQGPGCGGPDCHHRPRRYTTGRNAPEQEPGRSGGGPAALLVTLLPGRG